MSIPTPVYPSRYIYIDLDGDNIPETDISARVYGSISGQSGQVSDDDVDRMASVGSLSFQLNNDDNAYTETVLNGKAVEIYVTFYSHFKCVYRGYVTSIKIASGTYGSQKISVTISDWFSIAYGTTVKNLPLSTFITADTALDILLGLTPNQPLSTDFDQGQETFLTVFDGATKKTIVYSELNRVVLSELGRLFLKFRDNNYSEVLRFESFLSRSSTTPLSKYPASVQNQKLLKYHGPAGTSGRLKYHGAVTDGFIKLTSVSEAIFTRLTDSDWDRDNENVVNEFTVSTPTRKIDASPVVLFNLEQPIFYSFDAKYGFYADFTDPNGGTVIQAYSIEYPIAGTDYKFTENEDGTGADLTSYFLNFSQEVSGNQFFFKFRNTYVPAYLTFCQLRGIGLYKYNSIDYFVESLESKQDFVKNVRAKSLTREYSNDQNTSKTFADRSIALDRYPRKKLNSIDLVANDNEGHLLAFMYLEQGDKIRVTDTRPAKTGDYYIQGTKFVIKPGGGIDFTWYLKEDPKTICRPIAVRNNVTATSENALDFGVLAHLANMPYYSYATWVKADNIDGSSVLFGKSAELALGAGRRGNYLKLQATVTLGVYTMGVLFESTKTGTNGRWLNDNCIVYDGNWYHVVVTYDNTNPGADPILYVNGSAISFPEVYTPSGTSDNDADIPTILFNVGPDPANPASHYYYSTARRTYMKNSRIYNRILTPSEVSDLSANPNDYDNVQTGLVFHGIYAPADNIDDYIGDTIENEDFVIEVAHGVAGIPYNSLTSSDTVMLKGYDPT